MHGLQIDKMPMRDLERWKRILLVANNYYADRAMTYLNSDFPETDPRKCLSEIVVETITAIDRETWNRNNLPAKHPAVR